MKAIPVKSKIDALQLLKISPFKEVIKPTVPHKHADYFELIFLSQGAGSHVIDDRIYDVLPPAVYFLKPGQTHCWDFSCIPRGFVILFREELLNRESLEIVYRLPAHSRVGDSETLLELISRFHRDYLAKSSAALLRSYLQLILLKVSEEQYRHNLQPEQPFNQVYYRFKGLLNERYQNVRKIKDYAAILGIPAGRLNDICKKASGKTPSTILNERLLLEAKTLLSHTALTIKEVAAELDFADTSHFVKFFKLKTNLTPGQYKEMAIPQVHRAV
ncbi:AraC family transcriptional regulator [Mucilaginibacter sp. UR6-11]|uniref:helix-turn-helix domain-containing protein n=1 Tax=Mucilaginibacter sp. UR6-11 TaxID=1435644 RepID=UPI001E3FBF43|nr:helix-turn-helix domain-containing protein [Mucilaginibacter sp. UR6-11]MCC8425480.1 AraC family transcriptional regulator [Mucilaginibacter sp. UR6-11]